MSIAKLMWIHHFSRCRGLHDAHAPRLRTPRDPIGNVTLTY